MARVALIQLENSNDPTDYTGLAGPLYPHSRGVNRYRRRGRYGWQKKTDRHSPNRPTPEVKFGDS